MTLIRKSLLAVLLSGVFAVPAFVLRGMLGREMADALLLEGQRVLPRKAEMAGFRFRYPAVDAALNAIFA